MVGLLNGIKRIFYYLGICYLSYFIMDIIRNFNNIPNERKCSSTFMMKLNGYTFEKVYIFLFVQSV